MVYTTGVHLFGAEATAGEGQIFDVPFHFPENPHQYWDGAEGVWKITAENCLLGGFILRL
jgi:hypothetical protein